jgi:hypothetical protein
MGANVVAKGDWQGLPNGRMVKELWLVRQSDLVRGSGMNFKAGAEVTKFDFAHNSCDFVEDEDLADSGKFWKAEVAWEQPKISNALNRWLFINRNVFFVAIMRDGNNVIWVSGDDVCGLRPFTKKSISFKNGYVIRLEGLMRQQAYDAGSSDIEIVLNGEFGEEFSNDFNI